MTNLPIRFVAFVLAAACTTPNPNYRPPHRDAAPDGSDGPGGVMRCTKHKECTSNVCLHDGACADPNLVGYVDPMGTDNTSCTQAMPCMSVQAALNTKRQYIKMTGTIDAHVVITDQDVTVLADPGATLTSQTVGNLLVVRGNSRVSIFDLVITGCTGTDELLGTGVLLPAGNAATLSLERVTISNSERSGLIAFGGVVTVIKSTIIDNGDAGAAIVEGDLNVTQSTIRNNRKGGIVLHSPTAFHITNNFIYRNGSNTSEIGGLLIEPNSGSYPGPRVGSKVEFNTIVDNQVGAAHATGGFSCSLSGFVAANNLIFRNVGGPGNPQTDGSCLYGNSLVTTPPNPGFVSATDYHLTAQTPSTIIDTADCAGTKVDIDGDLRPSGTACDLGADEYKPN